MILVYPIGNKFEEFSGGKGGGGGGGGGGTCRLFTINRDDVEGDDGDNFDSITGFSNRGAKERPVSFEELNKVCILDKSYLLMFLSSTNIASLQATVNNT